MTLRAARLGQTYRITAVQAPEAPRRHLAALGFEEGARVTCLLAAPRGDPVAFGVRGAVVALRKSQLQALTVREAE